MELYREVMVPCPPISGNVEGSVACLGSIVATSDTVMLLLG